MTLQNDLSHHVVAVDLDPIKFKLMDPAEGEGWSREKVDKVEIEYRRFLELCLENAGDVIVPSKTVDVFWHAHILDTKKYAVDCDRIFGYFLHHFPYLGSRGDADKAVLMSQFEKSNFLLKTRFGRSVDSDDPLCERAVCGGSCGGGDCGGGDISGLCLGVDMETRPTL